MTSIPWLEILTSTLMTFAGLSLVCLPVAVAAVRDVEITRDHVARYFAYMLLASWALSLLAAA